MALFDHAVPGHSRALLDVSGPLLEVGEIKSGSHLKEYYSRGLLKVKNHGVTLRYETL